MGCLLCGLYVNEQKEQEQELNIIDSIIKEYSSKTKEYDTCEESEDYDFILDSEPYMKL